MDFCVYPALVAQTVKNLPAMQETWVPSLSLGDPLEKEMATYSTLLPGEFHGQRTLAGYSPWGSQRAWHDLATFTFGISQVNRELFKELDENISPRKSLHFFLSLRPCCWLPAKGCRWDRSWEESFYVTCLQLALVNINKVFPSTLISFVKSWWL